MKIVLAGASGLVGTALAGALRARGESVRVLVRRKAGGPEEFEWKPERGIIPCSALEGADVVVNLAGAGIADARWTAARKELLRSSRILSTRTLVNGLIRSEVRATVFLSASAIGYYGECGDALLAEESPRGLGFLAGLCGEWENEALRAEEASVRVVLPRIGIVLSRKGGALARLLPLYRAGLGGKLGDGRAWMSWITLDDLVGALLAMIDEPTLSGPVNAVAPNPVTNREFSQTLGAALRRPAPWTVPSFALRLMLGAMADEMLLASARVAPGRLLDRKHAFKHPELAEALRSVLGKESA